MKDYYDEVNERTYHLSQAAESKTQDPSGRKIYIVPVSETTNKPQLAMSGVLRRD